MKLIFKKVQFVDGNRIEYVYTATGELLKKRTVNCLVPQELAYGTDSDVDASLLDAVDSTLYAGNVVYRGSGQTVVRFDGGYAVVGNDSTGTAYHFMITDYQGNVRAVYDEEGVMEQWNSYYPYGLGTDRGMNPGLQPYKYNGKELDRMHGLDMYDYGARMYDPAAGRFTSVDPMYRKYYHISPYAYCGGDPVNCIDINGDTIFVVAGLNLYAFNYNTKSFTLSRYYYDCGYNFEMDLKNVSAALTELMEHEVGNWLVKNLSGEGNVAIRVTYRSTKNDENKELPSIYDNVTSNIVWNPTTYKGDDKNKIFNTIALAHELAHSLDRISGTMNENTWFTTTDKYGILQNVKYAEFYATHIENLIRVENDKPLRRSYSKYDDGGIDYSSLIVEQGRSLYVDINGNVNYKRISDINNRFKY